MKFSCFRSAFARALVASALLSSSSVRAGQPGLVNVVHQAWVEIAHGPSPDGKPEMHFPRAGSVDVWDGTSTFKRVLVNWQTNPDGDPGIHPYTHGSITSSDSGFTWGSPTSTPNVDYMGLIKRWSDGQLLALPYYPSWGYGHATSFSFLAPYYTSSDNGASWVAHTDGVVNMGTQEIDSFRFHRGIIQNTDGSLFACAYLRFYGETDQRAALMQSTDGGRTWTYRSNIAYTASIGYSECTVVRCVDGNLLTVIRTEGQPLRYRRSTTNGTSWTAVAVDLPGLPANKGVDPYLQLMPNGLLVLTYGDDKSTSGNLRRDVHFAVCPDGNGTTWTNDVITYTSSASNSDLGNKSAGYTSVAPVTAHRFLQFSDRAEARYYSSSSPNPFSINKKIVDLVPSYTNRIDLKSKYAAGAITITTDLTSTNANTPETRSSAAFDQSTEYWSGAFKTGTGTIIGSYTVDLQQSYPLNAVGVCLHIGTPESAVVEISNDNASWTAVKTYTNATHYAIDYTSFTAQSVRYVRVRDITGSAPRIGLNELEIYTTTDTFENEAQNVAPHNYSVPNGGFWVADGIPPSSYGYQSSRSLYLYDGDATNKMASRTLTAGTSKTFEFRLRPKGYASGGSIQWRVLSGSTNAFRVAVFPDGSVKYFNASTWVSTTGTGSPAGAGTVALDSWSSIKVVVSASTGTGTLYVNGVLKGTIGKESTVSTLDGYMFASSGSSATGDQAFFDDVSFQ